MATRYVEYTKNLPNPRFDPSQPESDDNVRLIRDDRDRNISEYHRTPEHGTIKCDYLFRKRPDLGDAYADRRICEIDVNQHVLKLTSQVDANGPIFSICEDLELDIAAGPVREVFEKSPELIQEFIVPVVAYFLGEQFVTNEKFEEAVNELKEKLAKKANAKPGRPAAGKNPEK